MGTSAIRVLGGCVSMLFLLLRLLTSPTTLFPAAAIVETTTHAQAAVLDSSSLGVARASQATIDEGPVKIRALLRSANDTQYHASCVAQRLAEAQVHVALARDEMHRLTDPNGVSAGDRQHALRRLTLIAERTQEVERAARLCVDDDLSSISATKYETVAPSGLPRLREATAPLPPVYPCPYPGCLVVPAP
jgi:hypothetical protein